MSFRLQPGYHFGQISKSCNVAGFVLTETIYSPSLKIPDHSHEQACFCLVLQGSYAEIYGGTVLACKPLSLLFRPPGETHSDHIHGAGGLCFIIEVEHSWLEQVREYSVALDAPTTFQGGTAAWLALKVYKEFKHLDEVSALAVQGLALTIAAELSRHPGIATCKPPRWMGHVKEILHARFSENLSLAGIAALVGVHPVYLASAFRRCYRCTIGDYVRQLRVEYACREILDSDAPLVEIALAAGFSNQAHFSRTFKRITGMTPLEYRAVLNPS